MLGLIGMVFLAAGLALATIALIGLLRMPDIFAQLHAAGLVTGPALVLVFLLVTSPLSSHAIAQAARRRPARRRDAQPADTSKP